MSHTLKLGTCSLTHDGSRGSMLPLPYEGFIHLVLLGPIHISDA